MEFQYSSTEPKIASHAAGAKRNASTAMTKAARNGFFPIRILNAASANTTAVKARYARNVQRNPSAASGRMPFEPTSKD